MNQKCSCGNEFTDPIPKKPRPWFWLGNGERVCERCVREAVVLAGHREDVRDRDVLVRRLGW